MEQTPFDSAPKDQDDQPNASFEDFSQSVPSTPSSQSSPSFHTQQTYVPPPFVPTTKIESMPPPIRTSRKSPLPWLIPLVLVVCVGGGLGFSVWDKHQQQVARERKLADLRASIKKIVLQDNALVMELLDPDALEHITYAEFFERADKNKDARDELVRQLRATESGPYGEDVGHYVELLEEENKWVRAEEAISRSQLDASTKNDTLKRATGDANDASGEVQDSRQAYLAAPYGEDFSEKTSYDIAMSRAKNANDSASQAFDDWKAAQQDLSDKKRQTFVIISDWLRDEPLKYPSFVPARDVSTMLITRKAEYASAASGTNNPISNDTQSNSVVSSSSASTPVAEATATPEPAVPTRTHALKPLDGERFSETRMEDIDATFASNLNDDDLRYAINEMYARYGMTFKDKSLQAQFERTIWYRPDDKWTMPQVKAAFTKRELGNLNVLVRERNQRQQGNSGATSTDTNQTNVEDG